MKRILVTAFLASVFVLALAMPALAQGGLALYIDNKQVAAEPGTYYEPGDGTYYLDVPPESAAGRVYVPLRTISLFLGAEIHWQSPRVFLTYGETAPTLTPGSQTALKNGAEWDLDAAPYLKNSRTMVPLRFVAEAFGCKVGYANGKVYVNTQPLLIDGAEIQSVQRRIKMTMGGIISESKTNACVRELYRFLISHRGEEISAPEPEHYGEMSHVDYLYFFSNEVSFMDAGAKAVRQYQIFGRNRRFEEMGLAEFDQGAWLIYDVTADKWHQLTVKDYGLEFWDRYTIGLWEKIYNDAP